MMRYEDNGDETVGASRRGWRVWVNILAAMAVQHAIATHRFTGRQDSPILAQIDDAVRNLKSEVPKHSVSIDFANQGGQLVVPALQGTGRFASWWPVEAQTAQNGLVWAALMVPLLVGVAAQLATNSFAVAALTPWLAACLWWLKPNAIHWTNGCVEVTLIGPICGLYLASLIHHHNRPGLTSLAGLCGSSVLGWLLFPVPWLLFFLPATLAWLVVAHRHDSTWHGCLILAVLLGAAPFVSGWIELVRQWSTVGTLMPNLLLNALPGAEASRSELWALGAIQLSLLLLPCVTVTGHSTGNLWGVCALTIAAVVGLTRTDQTSISALVVDIYSAPLPNEKSNDENSPFDGLTLDGSARLLAETSDGGDSRLPPAAVLKLRPLVPLLFGGRGSEELIPWAMSDGRLGSRPIRDWSDEELHRLFARWNVGWIWTIHPECTSRFEQYSAARPIRSIAGGVLYELDRPRRFVLKGQANWSISPANEIVLTDVVPEQGELVLSVRYYAGWTANPGPILVEPEIDPYDPLPIVRLRLDAPANRIVLQMGD